ncbi:hypothetical protein KY289_035630 [Solanum tuberosum]|nr:hypothetical protein KY289_035630 [Solanum tuberosum]
MTPRKKRTTPTKKYERRIRTQRQREEEELENTNLKKSIEEEGEHEIDVSSTNVERDDRAVEEEQNDIAIPENETSPIVESSPLSPSSDNFIVKSISGMPICFGMKEFAIITGLNCHNEEVYDGGNMSTKTKMRRKEILEVVGRSCKRNELIEHLQTKNLSKDWILPSADRKAFSAYPWGRISYDTTIKYLLKAVKTIDGKTTNLYGFPWAFMCWAFEIVPFPPKEIYGVFETSVFTEDFSMAFGY